jgi:hypothetical protein
MDQVYGEIGAFGRYQKRMVLVIGLISAQVAATFFSTVFTSASPALTCPVFNSSSTPAAAASAAALNSTSSGDTFVCQAWSLQQLQNNNNEHNTSIAGRCEFDTRYFERTIITEWGLVCDKIYLTGIADTVYMIGTTTTSSSFLPPSLPPSLLYIYFFLIGRLVHVPVCGLL